MYYQLPNGKVVQMSVEEYLSLTSKDIQYLLSVNAGEYLPNPWSGSAISKSRISSEEEIDPEIDEEITEYSEEIEFYFEDFFPDEFDDPEPRIDLDYDL